MKELWAGRRVCAEGAADAWGRTPPDVVVLSVAARAAIHDDGVWCRVAGIVARGKRVWPTLGDQAMRTITDEEIESALRGTQRVEFFSGEQARLPGGPVTFIGSVVDAVIRITDGLGPRDYGNVLDVATYNNVLAVASRYGEPKG